MARFTTFTRGEWATWKQHYQSLLTFSFVVLENLPHDLICILCDIPQDKLSVLHASNVALSQSDLLALDPPTSFICPISLSLMKDPVLLPETQQTYDR